jgi:hypothetical protein
MFGESCSSWYTEHNKIGLAIFGFFYGLLWILQVAVKAHKRGRSFFANRTLESI